MPLPSSINDLSQTAGSNSPSGSEAPSLIDDYLQTYASYIAQHRDGKGFALEASLASAATCDIGAANSLIVQITGTTGITSFGTTYSGPRIVRFAAALTLTHSATLVLPGAANITVAAGDFLIAVPNGNPASGWRVTAYQSAQFVVAGNRITGDFSNATIANRVMFQTSTANSPTQVRVIPSGTGTTATMQVGNNSDPNNQSVLTLSATPTAAQLASSANGTGSTLPLDITAGGLGFRVDTTGNVLVTNNTGGLGYGTGAGGTVTQATSKSTTVTLNRPTGRITTAADALGASSTVSFVFNNSVLGANDVLQVSLATSGSISDMRNYNVWGFVSFDGVAVIAIRNISGGSLSEAVQINFAIIKGATS